MSNDQQRSPSPSLGLGQPIHLGQQKKRAKELLRALGAAEPAARDRLRRHLPGQQPPHKLAHAQLVVAREAGFRTWTQLKLHAEDAMRTESELLETILDAALSANDKRLQSALERLPQAADTNLHVAAVLGLEERVARLLDGSAIDVQAKFGVRNWSALAYCCHARWGRDDAEVHRARAAIAKRLIAAGADSNECVDAIDVPGGQLSILAAAAWHTTSAELVDALIVAGADLEPPGSTAGPPAPPLVAAANGGRRTCVDRLIASNPPHWQAREALEVALRDGDLAMATALLNYGAIPNGAGRWHGHRGSALHAVLLLGLGTDFVELLLDSGVSVDVKDRDGRTALRVAVQVNAIDAAALLQERGARAEEIEPVDRLIGAAAAGNDDEVARLSSLHPEAISRCTTCDHQMVCWSVCRGNVVMLAHLLAAGFDANVTDDNGETALHLAVQRNDASAVKLLLERGASPLQRNFHNLTPIDLATERDDDEVLRLLSIAAGSQRATADQLVPPEHLATRFELAVDAIVNGDTTRLTQLLDETPELITTRSPRYHRATLLHYIGSNGTERVAVPKNLCAIAELLLERGAEVDASCLMYGGGPDQTTLGMVATSSFPAQAGLTEGLIAVLVRHGAQIDGPLGTGALDGAIEYANHDAIRALKVAGVRAHDLASAAALGDLEALDDHWSRLPKPLDPDLAPVVGAMQNAAALNQLGVLQWLLERGAALDGRDANGATALHKAAAANAAASIRWLLDRGANASLRDGIYDGTPLGWANACNSADAKAILDGSRQR